MRKLSQNLKYAFRILLRAPGFAVIAVFSLALGIGASTAIFTLVNAVLLRDLPVRHPEQLFEISAVRPDGKTPFSYPMFQEVEHSQRVFSDLMGWSAPAMVNTDVDGVLSQSSLIGVTGSYYTGLGVSPLFGRLVTPYDVGAQETEGSLVAVISYGFWQRRFGSAPNVIGKALNIEGESFTIIGVTRKWFAGMTTGQPPDLTIPISVEPRIQDELPSLSVRSRLWVFVAGRLRDNVRPTQARSQLLSFWPEVLSATAPTQASGLRRQTFLSMGLELTPARTGTGTDVRSQLSRPLYMLAGIVGLILVVACVNLANLMLARAAARSRDMSVRVAMGATRYALAGQELTESLVLSIAGALFGLVFSYWGSRFLAIFLTEQPVSLDLGPDLRVLSVALGMALLTGVLLGLAPACYASNQDPASVLKRGAGNSGRSVGMLTKALIIAQVALSLILLTSAGLLVKSFQHLRSATLGFDKDNLLEASLSPTPGGYGQLDMNSYHRQLIERIATMPGVRSVCYGDAAIPNRGGWHDDASPVSGDTSATANAMMVSPGFFDTLGIQLLKGRDFYDRDDTGHGHVAIVSSSLAKSLFPDGEAIGKTIRFGFLPEFANVEIIGIAGDARVFDVRKVAHAIYFPYLQYPEWTKGGSIYVRGNKASNSLSNALGTQIESLGHEYALRIQTVNESMRFALAEERLTAILSSFFSGLNVLLASIGLYGLMSYLVTRRNREVGIRFALGARRSKILWLLMRDAVSLTLVGIAVGIPCSVIASRTMRSMLFESSANDWSTATLASLFLVAVAAVAAYLPARKGAAIDPVVWLRTE